MLVDDLLIVLKVAEFKSIKAAAESLDTRVATASAAVKRVEKAYGLELFVRSTRNLRLSSDGEKFIPQFEEALNILNRIGQSVKEERDVIDGNLRLSVPSDLGRNIVLPWLDDFMQMHPALSIRLHVSDSNTDFYRDPVDIALRYGAPKDSSMYGFKLCDVPRILCASPDYISKNGKPEKPEDLQSHNGLLYQLNELTHDIWEFSKDENKTKVKISGKHIANDADLIRRWCVNSKGIAVKSILDMSSDLLAGRLTRLLPDYEPKPTELWLICPSRQIITPAVRLLRDDLKRNLDKLLLEIKRASLC